MLCFNHYLHKISQFDLPVLVFLNFCKKLRENVAIELGVLLEYKTK